MPKRSRPLPSASSVVASSAEADEYTFFGPAGLTHVHVSATDKEAEWEVLVVDEAQAVQNRTATPSQLAQMALRIRADHRWCVTGTPLSEERGLVDGFDLLEFLELSRVSKRRCAGFGKPSCRCLLLGVAAVSL